MRKILELIIANGMAILPALALASPCDHLHFIVENHTEHSFHVDTLQILKGAMDIHTGDMIKPGTSTTWVIDSETGSHGNARGSVTLQHEGGSDSDEIKLSYKASSFGAFCSQGYPKVEFTGPYTVRGELESFGWGFHVHGFRYYIKPMS